MIGRRERNMTYLHRILAGHGMIPAHRYAPVMTIPLSALELAPTEDGGTTAAALDAAVQTVRRLDELGYRRAWFAEHHGSAFFASVVPSILIAHLAAQTGRIRLVPAAC